MEYTREYWQPRIATNPNRFRKLNESNDYVEMINEPEAITQAGTAFTAARLNNMESGITGAVAGVNEIQGVVDFTTVSGFFALGQTSRSWRGMTTRGDDVYACVYNGDIYKQTGGVGDFIELGQTSRPWRGMTTLGGDVYACVNAGDIYKQTGGVGDFIALGQTSRDWYGMTTHGDDVYASVLGGDIYKQTGGVGDFIELGQTSRRWRGMTTFGDDVYACVDNDDIYKQTGGAGDFIALGQPSIQWIDMTTRGDDVYACVQNGDIYKQTGGAGDFIALGQTSRQWFGMTTLGDDVYACVNGGDIYTATVLTGNTFRASSSFSLPAMPDGARKRILNTHETTAITVTAYSGTTIEGQATMTLSAGHEVELELIWTDWKKTGWNEKSLASFVGPVDCSSRVAEYTGDGGGATVKDRAGNGNDLTATDTTYVNGKYGKEMSFNGSTSYAQASSPVIGTTGTISIRLKPASLSAALRPFGNRNISSSGGVAGYISLGTGVFEFQIVKSDGSIQGLKTGTVSTSSYTTFTFTWDGTTIKTYREGILINSEAQLESAAISIGNLSLGRMVNYQSDYFNGTISHFRYDSRIWTADEARAWSLNPISIDSRV